MLALGRLADWAAVSRCSWRRALAAGSFEVRLGSASCLCCCLAQGLAASRTRGLKDSWPQGLAATRTRGHKDSWPQGLAATRTRGHKDSRPQGLAATRTRGLKDSWPQGLVASRTRGRLCPQAVLGSVRALSVCRAGLVCLPCGPCLSAVRALSVCRAGLSVCRAGLVWPACWLPSCGQPGM